MSFFRYSAEVSETVRKKFKFYVILIVFFFLCLWMRVWYLQILKGDTLRELSENNRVRLVTLAPYRGIIKDRNGETLVGIRPSFNLYITPEDTKDRQVTLEFLAKKIQFDQKKVLRDMKEASSFSNVLIKADLSHDEVAFVEENNMLIPGVHLVVQPLRDYLYKELAAQVLGYLGEISKAKLESEDSSAYQQGDLVGKDGIENIHEVVLRGKKGYKEVEVDVSGRELRSLRMLPPQSGNNLILTLDLRVQRELERLLTGTPDHPIAGAVVVMKVQTGEIIAIASKPSFDPNLFAAGISRRNWRKLLFDEEHPLQNRTIDGQYPPGSTYKIVTAYAGLADRVISPESTISCPGHFNFGRGVYRCWKKGGHGTMTVYDALVQSCDVFFYTVGNRLGIDALARYAKKFGLGNYTGVRLIGEKPGLIPSTQWKLQAKNKSWLPGETISASIGQGYDLVTPMQQATLMAVVANGGMMVRPYLVKQVQEPGGKTLQEFYPEIQKKVELNHEYLTLIRKGLLGVVNAPHGTAHKAQLKNILVSGKTGTAQVVKMKGFDEKIPEDQIPYNFRDHAWFVAYAPFEDPEIAVSVVIEHGGHGGSTSAPIAKSIIETYFNLYPRDNMSAS